MGDGVRGRFLAGTDAVFCRDFLVTAGSAGAEPGGKMSSWSLTASPPAVETASSASAVEAVISVDRSSTLVEGAGGWGLKGELAGGGVISNEAIDADNWLSSAFSSKVVRLGSAAGGT